MSLFSDGTSQFTDSLYTYTTCSGISPPTPHQHFVVVVAVLALEVKADSETYFSPEADSFLLKLTAASISVTNFPS